MKLNIIIPTYLRSKDQRHLDLCLESVKNTIKPENTEINLVVVSSGDFQPDVDVNQMHNTGRMHFPEAVNWAINELPEADHYLILNDDVILTKTCLVRMLKDCAYLKDTAIIGPVSNCDLNIQHILPLPIMQNQLTMEDVEPHKAEIMNHDSPIGSGMFFTQQLFFYCVLIPNEIMKKVGLLDPKFLTGQDDLDYSWRVNRAGGRCAISLSSLVWHLSGYTTKHKDAMPDEMREKNRDYFQEKWGVKLW